MSILLYFRYAFVQKHDFARVKRGKGTHPMGPRRKTF